MSDYSTNDLRNFLNQNHLFFCSEDESRVFNRLNLLVRNLNLSNLTELLQVMSSDEKIKSEAINWLLRAKKYHEEDGTFSPLISRTKNRPSFQLPLNSLSCKTFDITPKRVTTPKYTSLKDIKLIRIFLEDNGIRITPNNEERILKRITLIANRFGFTDLRDLLELMNRKPQTIEDLLKWLKKAKYRTDDGSFTSLIEEPEVGLIEEIETTEKRIQFIHKTTGKQNQEKIRLSKNGTDTLLIFLLNSGVTFSVQHTDRIFNRLKLIARRLGLRDLNELRNLMETDPQTGIEILDWLDRGKIYHENTNSFTPLIHWEAKKVRKQGSYTKPTQLTQELIKMLPDPTDDENLPLLLAELEANHINYQAYKEKYFLRRLRTRMMRVETPSYKGYLSYLKQTPQELHRLVDSLSINFTRFFRDRDLFADIDEIVLPNLFLNPSIKIWSAGCAIGAEPFSIGILIAERGQKHVEKVTLIATDLSEDLIKRAQIGIYPDDLLKEVPTSIKHQYFMLLDEGLWKIDESIQNMVHFQIHDLRDPPPFQNLDLILCRNVLIYFSRPQVITLFKRFYEVLKPGGYLIIGKSEVLPIQIRKLFEIVNSRTHIYQRA